ncbi:hypothetical protein JXA32_05535 [Candidatus Sumerlaeota bacterium]|nr:hypothetical protein [Candidatus Sumerlaeota bacterium]
MPDDGFIVSQLKSSNLAALRPMLGSGPKLIHALRSQGSLWDFCALNLPLPGNTLKKPARNIAEACAELGQLREAMTARLLKYVVKLAWPHVSVFDGWFPQGLCQSGGKPLAWACALNEAWDGRISPGALSDALTQFSKDKKSFAVIYQITGMDFPGDFLQLNLLLEDTIFAACASLRAAPLSERFSRYIAPGGFRNAQVIEAYWRVSLLTDERLSVLATEERAERQARSGNHVPSRSESARQWMKLIQTVSAASPLSQLIYADLIGAGEPSSSTNGLLDGIAASRETQGVSWLRVFYSLLAKSMMGSLQNEVYPELAAQLAVSEAERISEAANAIRDDVKTRRGRRERFRKVKLQMVARGLHAAAADLAKQVKAALDRRNQVFAEVAATPQGGGVRFLFLDMLIRRTVSQSLRSTEGCKELFPDKKYPSLKTAFGPERSLGRRLAAKFLGLKKNANFTVTELFNIPEKYDAAIFSQETGLSRTQAENVLFRFYSKGVAVPALYDEDRHETHFSSCPPSRCVEILSPAMQSLLPTKKVKEVASEKNTPS